MEVQLAYKQQKAADAATVAKWNKAMEVEIAAKQANADKAAASDKA